MNKVIIIAEVGVNHNGSLSKALKLIDVAKKSGSDFVKFQTFIPELLVIPEAKKAKYQNKNDKSKNQLEMLGRLAIPLSSFVKIKRYCKKKKIKFLSTPFDIKSAKFLNKIHQKIIKISSGDLNNYPLLKEVSKYAKRIILSTGMSSLKEINDAIKTIKSFNKKTIINILHCTSQYPAKEKDLNLRAINLLKKRFNLEIGYSDHSRGNEASIAAVALGAKIIEKHLTLNNNLKGPDHKASLNPIDFKKFVVSIRKTEVSLGKEKKILTKSERDVKVVARKSIVASLDIKKGELFTDKNISTKRPSIGLSPMKWNTIIGKKSRHNYKKNDFIKK